MNLFFGYLTVMQGNRRFQAEGSQLVFMFMLVVVVVVSIHCGSPIDSDGRRLTMDQVSSAMCHVLSVKCDG
jgi:hypothetical protein